MGVKARYDGSMNVLTLAFIQLRALESAHDAYDFTLCQRSDGSYYGIADNKKCRQGTEASRGDEREISRGELLAYYQKVLGEKGISLKLSNGQADFSALNDEEFANVVLTTTQLLTDRPGKRIDVMSLGEYKALKKNEEFLRKVEKDPLLIERGFRPVSDAEMNATWALLPADLQRSLAIKGVNNATALNQDGSLGKATAWRGKEVLRRFLAQDGVDPFTGLRLNIYDSELEHIKGKEQFGMKVAENPRNWVMIRRGVNRQKGEKTLSEFLDYTNKMTPEGVHKAYIAARKRKEHTSTLDAKADAKMLAQGGYNIYKKWPERKLPLLMTALGIQNRYKETLRSGATAGRPGLQNKMPNFTAPGGGKVSPQGWIVLNWGNWTPAQREMVRGYINTRIYPKLSNGSLNREGAAKDLANFFGKLAKNQASMELPSPPEPKVSKPGKIDDKLDALLAAIRSSK